MLRKTVVLCLVVALAFGCIGEPGDGTAGSGGSGAGGNANATGGLAGVGGTGVPGGGAATGGGASTGGTASGGAAGGGGGTGGSFGAGGEGQNTGGVDASGGMDAAGGQSAQLEWLPSWATSIQSTEPSNLPPSLNNTTLRQFVWPTVSGEEIRIQLSNEKGSSPVDIQKVNIAMALTSDDPGNSQGQIDTATNAAFSFSGAPNVTIPAGGTVWSDALAFPLEEIKLTAITMQFGANVPPEITGHPGARTTSYIQSGDVVSQQGMGSAETRDRWYFINAIEVMAPADSYAIALLGDSITDGYGILNAFERWPDAMTAAIKNDPMIAANRSVLNFGMGANNLTVTGEYQDAGVIRFERDVLTRDKIKWLIVFEGVNDIESSNVQSAPIISAYQTIIAQAHDKGIVVYGSPITPTGSGAEQGKLAVRAEVNDWVRTSDEFDGVIDLDAVIRDPNNQNDIAAAFARSDGDSLHPSAAGYAAMGNSVDLSLFYTVP